MIKFFLFKWFWYLFLTFHSNIKSNVSPQAIVSPGLCCHSLQQKSRQPNEDLMKMNIEKPQLCLDPCLNPFIHSFPFVFLETFFKFINSKQWWFLNEKPLSARWDQFMLKTVHGASNLFINQILNPKNPSGIQRIYFFIMPQSMHYWSK